MEASGTDQANAVWGCNKCITEWSPSRSHKGGGCSRWRIQKGLYLSDLPIPTIITKTNQIWKVPKFRQLADNLGRDGYLHLKRQFPLAGLGQSAERFARILTLGSLSLWNPLEIEVGRGGLGQRILDGFFTCEFMFISVRCHHSLLPSRSSSFSTSSNGSSSSSRRRRRSSSSSSTSNSNSNNR